MVLIFFFVLPFFYAFTERDTVSIFYGKGKCKAYDVWVKSESKDDFTDVELGELAKKPTNVTFDHIDILVSFALQLYGSKQTHPVLLNLTNSRSLQITTCAYYH